MVARSFPGSSFSRRDHRAHIGGSSNRFGLLFLTAAIALVIQVKVGGFITTSNGLAILANVATIMIAAIAMARLMIALEIDLSIGGMFGLTAVLSGYVIRDTQNTFLGIVAGVLIGAALGTLSGVLNRTLRISPIIVTLGLGLVYTGMALVITGAIPVYGFPDSFIEIGQSKFVGIPTPVWISMIVFTVGAIALTRTVGGVRSYAMGGNPVAAELMGVNRNRHVIMLYTYMGASVGLVAVLTASMLQSASPNLGTNFALNVITAVVLGGVGLAGGSGRPLGVAFGVVIIGVINNAMIFLGVGGNMQSVVNGGFLILALLADRATEVWRDRPRKANTTAAAQREPSAMLEVQDREQAEFGEFALRVEHVRKQFGTQTAVNDVSFEVRAGQVLCLLGDNGAGKSTLIKMISGVVSPDSGRILLGDEEISGLSAAQVRARNVETVYQDLAVCPNMSAAVNLVLGHEPRFGRFGSLSFFDHRTSMRIARERMESLGIFLDDYSRPVSGLSGGQRQCVAVARTVSPDVKVAVLDEPTAALGVRQKASVLRLVGQLAAQGTAVIVITHDVESVKEIADELVVLFLGRVIHQGPARDVSARDLVHLMAGFELEHAAIPGDRPVPAGQGSM